MSAQRDRGKLDRMHSDSRFPQLTPAHVRFCLADDGAISCVKGAGRGLPAVLSHGRLLRTVLRRCPAGRAGARHRLDQPGRARGRADPDVRRAGACCRGHRRTDRKPDRGAQARRFQSVGGTRHRALRHRRHADRGSAAGTAPGQRAGGAVRVARHDRHRCVRHFHRPHGAGGMRARGDERGLRAAWRQRVCRA